MNNLPAIFPVRADLVGVFGYFQSVTYRKSRAGFFHHLFGFVEGIDRERDDVGILSPEFIKMRLEVGYLPNAIRSPDATVKDDNGVFAL